MQRLAQGWNLATHRDFIHLEDIKKLNNSLKDTMKGLSDPNATIHLPNIDRVAFPWEDNLEPYVGNPNDTTSDMK